MLISRSVYEYISQKNNDPVVEWRRCSWTGEEFPIFESDVAMLAKLSPTVGWVKYPFPLPTLSPQAREQRRMMFKNERFFHKDICEHTNTATVSRFTDKHVFSNAAWHGDDREQKIFDYDETPSFADAMRWLCDNTTYQDLIGSSLNVTQNARYTNHASKQSNTYLLINARDDEYCAYGNFITHSTFCFDCSNVANSEHCYQCVSSDRLFGCLYCYNCINSQNLHFCHTMTNCQYCFLCTGLHNQSYCINNKHVGKEAYEAYMASIDLGSYHAIQEILIRYAALSHQQTQSAVVNPWSEDVIGHECMNSHNAFMCFDLQSCHDVRYATACFESQDMMDITSFGELSSIMYEWLAVGKNSSNIFCSSMVGESHHLLYCMESKYCKHCFGCVNLYKKEYCIFNKQYTQEEYETIVLKLIEQLKVWQMWWEFLHPSLSPFPYNDSIAIDYYPPHAIIDHSGNATIYDEKWIGTVHLSDDNEIASWVFRRWKGDDIPIRRRNRREEINIPDNTVTIAAKDLPDSLVWVDESLLQKAIVCAVSWRPFRMVPMELEFYRKHNLPLPRLHPDVRYTQRFQQKPDRTLYLRKCDKTGEDMLSVYPQDAPFKVYSEEAYRQEMYG